MSIIIAIRLPNEYLVCSDGLAISLEKKYNAYYAGQEKIRCIPGKNLIFGFSGLKAHGDLIYEFITNSVLPGVNSGNLLKDCASFTTGLNDGFSETQAALEIKESGLVPQNGVLLAGFLHEDQIFAAILPNGNIVYPKRYAILGYTSAFISNYLKTSYPNIHSIDDALLVCRESIRLSMKSGFSNNELFYISVSDNDSQSRKEIL